MKDAGASCRKEGGTECLAACNSALFYPVPPMIGGLGLWLNDPSAIVADLDPVAAAGLQRNEIIDVGWHSGTIA